MTVIARINVSANAPWLKPFQEMVDGFSPGGQLYAEVLKRTMVKGILQAVRAKFFATMHHAVQVSIEGKTKNERIGKLVEAKNEVSNLKLAYRALDSAILKGNQSKIRAAQQRIAKAQNKIVERYARSKGGSLTEKRNLLESNLRLGLITGQLMRQNMLRVLQLLTASTNLKLDVYANATTLSAGAKRFLDVIETPSATVALSGERSKSRHKILWRHLEFGSGEKAKPAPDFSPKKIPWFYGRPGDSHTGGLKVIGTNPMSFLWTPTLQPATPAAGSVIQTVFEDAMLQVIPKLT